MKPTFLICGVVLAATAVPSMAKDTPKASTTTQQYVAMCQNKADAAAQNFCHGFGQGVYETYLITRHPKRAKPFVCIPQPGQSRQDAVDGFIGWSAKNPQFNDASAADTILRYLGETYPCKKA